MKELNLAPTIRTRVPDETLERELLAQGMDALCARICASRINHEDITGSPIDHIKASLSCLDDPALLPNIEVAAQRIINAIQEQQQIGLVVDHDVDGVTSGTLFALFFEQLGIPAKKISYYISHRLKEGYGLNDQVKNRILMDEPLPQLLITADCGSSDEARIQALKASGIDTIVSDHHMFPPEGAPKSAYAVVSPILEGPADPYLAGVGVAFYLMSHVRTLLINQHEDKKAESIDLKKMISIVGIGSLADCVNLGKSKNNRAFIRAALQRISMGERPAFSSFIHEILNEHSHVSSQDILFQLAPRIAAAGRLETAFPGKDFLLSHDIKEANKTLSVLTDFNNERKEIQKQLLEDALPIATAQMSTLDYCLVVYLQEGNAGVHGIVAAKIAEQFGRPTVVFSPCVDNPTLLAGSARAYHAELHFKKALDKVADKHPALLKSYGGHPAAAGMKIDVTDLDTFENALDAAFKSQTRRKALTPYLYCDGEIEPHLITLETVNQLNQLEPYGQGFEAPVFNGNFYVQNIRTVGQDQNHLRLTLKQKHFRFTAMWFFALDKSNQMPIEEGTEACFFYTLNENHYNGDTSLQLIIQYASNDPAVMNTTPSLSPKTHQPLSDPKYAQRLCL